MIFVMIAMSAASIRRIEEVFKEEPDIRNPELACHGCGRRKR